MDVPVNVNRRIFDYDQLIIVGPVFPHEVVGFSGGNKYLFPGVSGPEVLNFFHWLGAVVTNPMIIGNKYTPVRKVVDRAGSMVTVPNSLLHGGGSWRNWRAFLSDRRRIAWDRASDLSRTLHITYKDHPFHTVLSCAPLMYDELWVGGKCMYKLEPVVADGGELIIYAPHIHEISITHGALIRQNRLPLPGLLPKAMGQVQGASHGACWRIRRTFAALAPTRTESKTAGSR